MASSSNKKSSILGEHNLNPEDVDRIIDTPNMAWVEHQYTPEGTFDIESLRNAINAFIIDVESHEHERVKGMKQVLEAIGKDLQKLEDAQTVQDSAYLSGLDQTYSDLRNRLREIETEYVQIVGSKELLVPVTRASILEHDEYNRKDVIVTLKKNGKQYHVKEDPNNQHKVMLHLVDGKQRFSMKKTSVADEARVSKMVVDGNVITEGGIFFESDNAEVDTKTVNDVFSFAKEVQAYTEKETENSDVVQHILTQSGEYFTKLSFLREKGVFELQRELDDLESNIQAFVTSHEEAVPDDSTLAQLSAEEQEVLHRLVERFYELEGKYQELITRKEEPTLDPEPEPDYTARVDEVPTAPDTLTSSPNEKEAAAGSVDDMVFVTDDGTEIPVVNRDAAGEGSGTKEQQPLSAVEQQKIDGENTWGPIDWKLQLKNVMDKQGEFADVDLGGSLRSTATDLSNSIRLFEYDIPDLLFVTSPSSLAPDKAREYLSLKQQYETLMEAIEKQKVNRKQQADVAQDPDIPSTLEDPLQDKDLSGFSGNPFETGDTEEEPLVLPDDWGIDPGEGPFAMQADQGDDTEQAREASGVSEQIRIAKADLAEMFPADMPHWIWTHLYNFKSLGDREYHVEKDVSDFLIRHPDVTKFSAEEYEEWSKLYTDVISLQEEYTREKSRYEELLQEAIKTISAPSNWKKKGLLFRKRSPIISDIGGLLSKEHEMGGRDIADIVNSLLDMRYLSTEKDGYRVHTDEEVEDYRAYSQEERIMSVFVHYDKEVESKMLQLFPPAYIVDAIEQLTMNGAAGYQNTLESAKTWMDHLDDAAFESVKVELKMSLEDFKARWKERLAEDLVRSMQYLVMTKLEGTVLADKEYQKVVEEQANLPKESTVKKLVRGAIAAAPALGAGMLASYATGGVAAAAGAYAAFFGSGTYGALQLRSTKKNAEIQAYQEKLRTAREEALRKAQQKIVEEIGMSDIPLENMLRVAFRGQAANTKVFINPRRIEWNARIGDAEAEQSMQAIEHIKERTSVLSTLKKFLRKEQPNTPEAQAATADYVLSALALRSAQQDEASGFSVAMKNSRTKEALKLFAEGQQADVTGQRADDKEKLRVFLNALSAAGHGAIVAGSLGSSFWANVATRFSTSTGIEGVRATVKETLHAKNELLKQRRDALEAYITKMEQQLYAPSSYEEELAAILDYRKAEFLRAGGNKNIKVNHAIWVNHDDGNIRSTFPDLAQRLFALRAEQKKRFDALSDQEKRMSYTNAALDNVVAQMHKRSSIDKKAVLKRGVTAGVISATLGGLFEKARETGIFQSALQKLGISETYEQSTAADTTAPAEVLESVKPAPSPEPEPAPVPESTSTPTPEPAPEAPPAPKEVPEAPAAPSKPAPVPEAATSQPAPVPEQPSTPAEIAPAPAPEEVPAVPSVRETVVSQDIASHTIEQNESFLSGAKELQERLGPEQIDAIRDAHEGWERYDDERVLRQWRVEQAKANGQWFDSVAQYFQTRLLPGAEMKLEVGEDGYPRITLGDEHVERLDNVLVKERVQEIPMVRDADGNLVASRDMNGNILQDSDASADDTVPVESDTSRQSADVKNSQAEFDAAKERFDTVKTDVEAEATLQKEARVAQAAVQEKITQQMIYRVTTDPHILADMRTRAVFIKEGSTPLESFASEYIRSRSDFDARKPEDMYDFYRAWRAKSIEYITGSRATVPTHDTASLDGYAQEVAKGKTDATTSDTSQPSPEQQSSQLEASKTNSIVLQDNLGDDYRRHISAWDAEAGEPVDIALKATLQPKIRGGQLVLEISGQQTDGRLIKRIIDGKKQWGLEVELPQLGRKEFYAIDALNKGNEEPLVEKY